MNDQNRNLVVLGGLPCALLISLAGAGCALELNRLFAHGHPHGPEQHHRVLTFSAAASIAAAFLLPLLAQVPAPFLSAKVVFAGLVIASFADALFFESEIARTPTRVGIAVLGAAYPGLLLSALVCLRQLDRGAYWILLALVVPWFNDTGAYFAGRAFGRHKLYPRVSPSKTVEGAIGGLPAP